MYRRKFVNILNMEIIKFYSLSPRRLLDNNVLTCVDEASIRELKDLEIL